VGVEYELCALGILARILEEIDDLGDEMRMQAGIEFVNQENVS